ncbi:MAG: helix-turn-helix domain-containing protein, partial [Gammaproteobacteria bacterium]
MSSENIETRTRILDATVRMLEEQGGRGVRMGDIAKAAGISRQAVYLHFSSRAELLEATTKYRDRLLDLDRRLAPSRAATSGVERLALYIEFWGHYIPEVYGVAKALLLAQDTDEAAAAAWQDRMLAMRDGCRAAIDALHADGKLA